MCRDILLEIRPILPVYIAQEHLRRECEKLFLDPEVNLPVDRNDGFQPVARVLQPCRNQRHPAPPHKSLAEQTAVPFHIRHGPVFRIERLQKASPLLRPFRRSGNPFREFRLLRPLVRRHVEPVVALHLPLIEFLHIAQPEIPVGILQPHLRVGIHPPAGNLHLSSPHFVRHRQSHILLFRQLERA